LQELQSYKQNHISLELLDTILTATYLPLSTPQAASYIQLISSRHQVLHTPANDADTAVATSSIANGPLMYCSSIHHGNFNSSLKSCNKLRLFIAAG
jgi:hypothetical protein